MFAGWCTNINNNNYSIVAADSKPSSASTVRHFMHPHNANTRTKMQPLDENPTNKTINCTPNRGQSVHDAPLFNLCQKLWLPLALSLVRTNPENVCVLVVGRLCVLIPMEWNWCTNKFAKVMWREKTVCSEVVDEEGVLDV